MLKEFTALIEEAGGYVNPSLNLLVGEDAEHGELSLSGVAANELALIVPAFLGEHKRKRGPWCEFCESLGYKINGHFFCRNNFEDGVFPLLSAANHSEEGGRLEKIGSNYHLYGATLIYSTDAGELERIWGIT